MGSSCLFTGLNKAKTHRRIDSAVKETATRNKGDNVNCLDPVRAWKVASPVACLYSNTPDRIDTMHAVM